MKKQSQYDLIIVLLSIALILSLSGTIINLNRLHNTEYVFSGLTGAASFSYGFTNLTITSNTALSLFGGNGTTLNFGSGYINSTCNATAMDSNNINISYYANGSNLGANGRCGVGFSGVSTGFLIENTGNINVSVGYVCTGNCTHALFIGGARIYGTNGIDIKVTQNVDAQQSGEDGGIDTAASCQGGGSYYRDTGWNITNSSSYTGGALGSFGTGSYTAFAPSSSGSGHYLCGNSSHFPLASDNNRDAAVVDFNITIGADAPASGVRSSFTITFNGTSSG